MQCQEGKNGHGQYEVKCLEEHCNLQYTARVNKTPKCSHHTGNCF